jgi:uncharacterized protein
MTLVTPMTPTTDSPPAAARVAALDWSAIERSLDERGHAVTEPLLTPGECEALVGLYDDDTMFRSRVDMTRHRFGEGEYKYFAAPLPPLVGALRAELYPPLARIANRWSHRIGDGARYPETLDEFLARCAEAGQTKPTPLVLRYEAGGYNCLHQDVYGSVAFPLQALVPLSRPGVDYTGGELLFVEQRPRAQSAGEAVLPPQGALVFFTTRTRPVAGARGHYRVNVRHGVSRVRSGTRHTLGVIFHDAA